MIEHQLSTKIGEGDVTWTWDLEGRSTRVSTGDEFAEQFSIRSILEVEE